MPKLLGGSKWGALNGEGSNGRVKKVVERQKKNFWSVNAGVQGMVAGSQRDGELQALVRKSHHPFPYAHTPSQGSWGRKMGQMWLLRSDWGRKC